MDKIVHTTNNLFAQISAAVGSVRRNLPKDSVLFKVLPLLLPLAWLLRQQFTRSSQEDDSDFAATDVSDTIGVGKLSRSNCDVVLAYQSIRRLDL